MERLNNGADLIEKLKKQVLHIEVVDLSAFFQPVLPDFELVQFNKED